MSLPVFAAVLAVLSVCAPPLSAQATGEPLLRLPGLTVTRQEYLEHLYAAIGGARLEDVVLDRALAAEVQRLGDDGLARVGTATRAALADPDARARASLEERITRDFGGERARWLAHLRNAGTTEAEAFVQQRLQALRDDRLTALVQAGRSADEKSLRALFDHHYGVDGVRVTVRHVLVAFGRVRHELAERRRGAGVGEAEVERIARERIDALARKLDDARARLGDAGQAFDEVALESDDPRGRSEKGAVPGYNFQEFGSEFAQAVRALRPGEVSPPVRSSHGWHLVQLASERRTRFEDVQPELRRLLREEPPTLAELQRCRAAVLERVGFKRAR